MIKKIKLIIVSLILLAIIGINISYAISSPNTSSFFEVNKKELSSGEILEMTIDLSKINYEQFKLVLNSNVEIEKVYTKENELADSNLELDKEDNDVVINIDKGKMSLNKIVLYYQIPENIELGTKLQLNAQVIVSENEEEKVVDKKQFEITIVKKDNNREENGNQEDNKNEINNSEDNKNQVNNKNENSQNEENKLNETASKNPTQNSIQNMQGTNANKSVSSTTSGLQTMSNSSSNTKTSAVPTETVTYKGSNNNYLSSLEIDGVQLTTNFNKENSTYFATVKSLETITVKATAEDSSSRVAITRTDLKSGENKVLISVTAENGNVRYYRIYVTNN